LSKFRVAAEGHVTPVAGVRQLSVAGVLIVCQIDAVIVRGADHAAFNFDYCLGGAMFFGAGGDVILRCQLTSGSTDDPR
jgi:hypothetical protein